MKKNTKVIVHGFSKKWGSEVGNKIEPILVRMYARPHMHITFCGYFHFHVRKRVEEHHHVLIFLIGEFAQNPSENTEHDNRVYNNDKQYMYMYCFTFSLYHSMMQYLLPIQDASKKKQILFNAQLVINPYLYLHLHVHRYERSHCNYKYYVNIH